MRTKLLTPRDMLSHEPVTSPLKKKSKITFGSPINDFEEDEERTCLDEIEGRGGEELDVTATHDNIEEESEPDLDHVITNIQDELVVSIEFVVFIPKPVTIATKSFQHVQLVVEHLQMENPQFLSFQPILIYSYSIETLK